MTQYTPLISVIIAAYNAELYIAECINSILDQTHTNWEIWICDDNSSDNTLQILKDYNKKYPNIHILHNDQNIYAGASRNRCIENCNGEYIAILDADDVCDSHRLEVLLKHITNNTIDFVSSGHYLFDDKGIYRTVTPKIKSPTKKNFLYCLPFCHAATMFSAQSLKAINGYRISHETRRGQDYDLFMRLYVAGYRGENIKDVLYGYRVDSNTIGRRKFRYRIDECIIRYKGFKKLGLLPLGFPWIFKPIVSHLVQLVKIRRRG